MKRYIIGIIAALIIIVDLSVALYPTIGKYFNSLSQSRAVTRYIDDMAGMKEENIKALLEAAHTYNENLFRENNRFELTEDEGQEYNRQLDTGSGIMGILIIDMIDIKLPIYHGTDETVLQIGLGHMPGTSLPVGGNGTHSFITGHRGVPSATLFTDLNKMAMGDTFALYVMGETLTYQVDNIQIVEPHEISSMKIDRDMDYCTLVTCTPYGVNTHRLLVRGRRIENAANISPETLFPEARLLDKFRIILIFMVPVVPALMIAAIIKCRKTRKGGIIQL